MGMLRAGVQLALDDVTASRSFLAYDLLPCTCVMCAAASCSCLCLILKWSPASQPALSFLFHCDLVLSIHSEHHIKDMGRLTNRCPSCHTAERSEVMRTQIATKTDESCDMRVTGSSTQHLSMCCSLNRCAEDCALTLHAAPVMHNLDHVHLRDWHVHTCDMSSGHPEWPTLCLDY